MKTVFDSGDVPVTWATTSKNMAKEYGPNIETIAIKPNSKILNYESDEYYKLIEKYPGATKSDPDLVKAAIKEGYDILSYDNIGHSVGTVVLNPDSIVREGAGKGAYETWRIANRFYREGQEGFNNAVIRRLIKMADDTGTGAEMIAPAIFKPGKVSTLRKVMRAADPTSRVKLKGFFMEHIIQKSTNVDGEITGKRLLNNLSGKPGSFGMPMLKEAFTDGQIESLRMLGRAAEIAEKRQAEGAGKVLIQLSQAGAIGAILKGTLEIAASTILIGPAVLGRMMLNPSMAHMLTRGLTMPARSPQAAGLLARLVAAAHRISNDMEEYDETKR